MDAVDSQREIGVLPVDPDVVPEQVIQTDATRSGNFGFTGSQIDPHLFVNSFHQRPIDGGEQNPKNSKNFIFFLFFLLRENFKKIFSFHQNLLVAK